MTDNSNAPERIWAFHAPELAEDNCGGNILAHDKFAYGGREYIRADGETVTALVEALESYADELCEYPSTEFCGKLHEHSCQGCRARAALAKVEGE